jgi:hypothetical protein
MKRPDIPIRDDYGEMAMLHQQSWPSYKYTELAISSPLF